MNTIDSNNPPSVRLSDSIFGLRFVALVVGVALTVALFVGWLLYLRSSHGIAKPPIRLNVDLKALGNFKLNDQTGSIDDIPPMFRALDGKLVVLEGFMYAGSAASDKVSSFQLVYSLQYHSFQGPPLVQERVFVSAPGNKTVEITGKQVRVTGTLHVKIERDETGRVIKVYSMDLDHIEPL